MEVSFTPSFVKQYKALPLLLQWEIKEKIRLFNDPKNHKKLNVHKLSGKLHEQYAFNVNYKIRIVFWYTATKPKAAILLAVGDHDVYNR